MSKFIVSLLQSKRIPFLISLIAYSRIELYHSFLPHECKSSVQYCNSIFLFGSASLLGFNQNPSLIACTCEIIRRTHVFLRCRLGDKACWKSRRPCRHDQIEREGRRTEEEWEGRGGGHQGQEPELLPSLLAPVGK